MPSLKSEKTSSLFGVCFKGCILILSLGVPFFSASAQMESAVNRYFETVGLDRRSVNYMNELSLYVGQRAARYVNQRDLEYPQPILLRLWPPDSADFRDDHRIRLGERSAVQLDLRWSANLSLDRACLLLSKALLLQYTVYTYGPGRAPSMRAWPIAALGLDAYLGLRPAEVLRVQQDLRREANLAAGSILSLKTANGDAPPASAYWLSQALRILSREGQLGRRFFKQALSGIDVAEPLAIQLSKDSPQGPGIQLEAWWARQRDAILSRSLEAFESMQTSREWLEAVADLGSVAIVQVDEPVNLRSLRAHRDSEEVRELIAARYQILRLRLGRCNPAFFNAAQSLGALFETFLNDEASHRYLHALIVFLGDMEDAKELQIAIGSKLSGDEPNGTENLGKEKNNILNAMTSDASM